jgi:hypothetical protein
MKGRHAPPHPYRRTAAYITPAVTLCVTLSACGRSSDPASSHVDAFPRLVADAGMRIGNFDDPDLGFSQVYSADVDSDGNIYVLEGSVPEIRVFSPEGKLLRRIGRRGAGPGEFEGPPPRFGVVGDTVWAVTLAPNRITLFHRDGTLISARRAESVSVPLPNGYAHLAPWNMRPDGRFTSHVAWLVYRNRDEPPTGVEATDSIPVPFVLYDATGAVLDTIGWAGRPPPGIWRPPGEDDYRLESIQVGGRRYFVPHPTPAGARWLPLADGYVSVEPHLAETPEDGVFTVTRFGLSGDTVYTRTFHYRPVRYAAAELDTIAAHAARGEPGGGVPFIPTGVAVPADWEAIARSLRNAMDFPEFKVPIDNPWLAQDESVWLRLRDGHDATARWILLDPQGRPRGQLELPSDIRVLWNRGDAFWAVDPDEFDVPWVVRFRIRPG